MIIVGLRRGLLISALFIALLLGGWVVWKMLDPAREGVLFRKTVSLYWRSPEREAGEAARRGDFRLGIAHVMGPMPSRSSLPGVNCEIWFVSATGKRLYTSDMRLGGDDMHEAAARRFLTRYNQALVANRAFPYPELCAREGAHPASRYIGPVRNYGEAARANDLVAVRRLAGDHAPGINHRDMLGYTALQWALRNGHREVATNLLKLGADPNLRGPDPSGDTSLGPAPLARALLNRDDELVGLLLARGAQMEGRTGLCDVDYDIGADEHRCTWAGLVANRRRLDLLPIALAADNNAVRDPDDPSTMLTGRDELVGVFVAMVQRNDPFARNLIPFLREDNPRFRVAWLRAQKREDLAVIYARQHPNPLGYAQPETNARGLLLNSQPSSFGEQLDSHRWPDAPPEPARSKALVLINDAARQHDQWSLEKMLQETVGRGWDELSGAILRAGFDPRLARRPDVLWSRWASPGSPCRPTTGVLLVRASLPTTYPLNPLLNGEPPMWIMAAGCANPASARVLAMAAPMQLEFMEEDGSTLVDVAEQHQRPFMAAALRKLGVRAGTELTGKLAATRAARRRAIDWDIVQSGETR